MPLGIIKLPDVPLVSLCDDAHLAQMTPDGTQTFRDVREQFLLDIAAMKGRTLAEVVRVVEKMRMATGTYPSEFTDEALAFTDRLHANAVAQRLLGNLLARAGGVQSMGSAAAPSTGEGHE